MKKFVLAAAALAALTTAANAQVQPGPNLHRGRPYTYDPNTGYFGPARPVELPRPRTAAPPPPPPVYEPATFGNGCANFGKVVVEQVEKVAAERREQKIDASLTPYAHPSAVVRDAETAIDRVFRLNPAIRRDGRNFFIPGKNLEEALDSLKSINRESFKTCFPEYTAWVDKYSIVEAQVQATRRAKAAQEEAARRANVSLARAATSTAGSAEPFAEPPKQYSIVEVAHESRACRPAFSNNCITLKEGERVVVLAWQIDGNPRRGLYCLRPLNMGQCYYADLTAIEINGKPAPTIGMDKLPDEKPITADDCKPLPQGIEGMKSTTMDRLARHEKCLAMDGGERLLQLYTKWVYVSVCNKSREGYLVQYVNDFELERAQRGVRGAERELLKRNPSLGERKDDIWQTALQDNGGKVRVFPELCKNTALELGNASPEGAIIVPKP